MLLSERHLTSEHSSKEIPLTLSRNKNIKSLILQYLKENAMPHSAFCFGHEANVSVDKYMTSGRLLNLVEKGIQMEQREKNSSEKQMHYSALPITVNRSSKQFKKKAKLSQKYSSTYETMSNQLSLEDFISSQVQFQLQQFKMGAPSESSITSINKSNPPMLETNTQKKMHPRRKKNMTCSGFSQIKKELKPIRKKGKKSMIKGIIRTKAKNSKQRFSENPNQNPKSILKNSSRRKSNFAEDTGSFTTSYNPKSKKSITIRDIKSLNCSEIKETNTQKITSSKRYETEHTIKLTDEAHPAHSLSQRDVKNSFLSIRKDSGQIFNEGFSFGGSEKEAEISQTPKKKKTQKSKRNSVRKSGLLSTSMYDNGFPSIPRGTGHSSEEIINSSKYFYNDSGLEFEPYEFRSHENYVIVFDKYLKKICMFNVPQYLEESNRREMDISSTPMFFSLTETFSKRSPFFTMGRNLIFYTASQFVAFDYK
jgi:hypothetical protein